MLPNMTVGAVSMAEVAALVGDPARALMLDALAGGRAQTAGELAYVARIAPSTTSGHLAKLADARIVVGVQCGRHRYYRLASPLVGRMLESILAVAATQSPPRHRPPTPDDAALAFARTCYDHLAGHLAVEICDRLVARRLLELDEDGGEVTRSGVSFFADFGLDLAAMRATRRVFCRPCMDWTERRLHVAGALGAGLARRCLELGWLERRREGRALRLTALGREGLAHRFGLELEVAALPRTAGDRVRAGR
jgi:DNA-binding transcriptional ArsR family regulator